MEEGIKEGWRWKNRRRGDEGGRKKAKKEQKQQQNLLCSECQNGNSLCKVLRNTNVIDLF